MADDEMPDRAGDHERLRLPTEGEAEPDAAADVQPE